VTGGAHGTGGIEGGSDGTWHDGLLMDLLADELVREPPIDAYGVTGSRRLCSVARYRATSARSTSAGTGRPSR
jgi:hypothetical protein